MNGPISSQSGLASRMVHSGTRRMRGPLRVVAGPILGYVDRRLQDMYDRVDERLNILYDRVATEVETISELTLGMQRFVDVSAGQIDEMLVGVRELVDSMERIVPSVGLAGAASAGPAPVEVAFAMAASAHLAPAARVLVGGAAGGGLAVSLASLGFHVTTVGERPAGVSHRDLEEVVTALHGWEGPADPFDAVFLLSRWWEGDTGPASVTPDRDLLDLCRKWLAPGGQLVVSFPGSAGTAGDTTGAEQPDALLDDWEVVERRLFVSHDATTWEAVAATEESSADGEALALVRAKPLR
ncbi:MAG: hypothetical protein M3011_07350 [Actinomycetota bacterium]|nr:hypothetical protein [Actinomycetota bacterium]